MLAQIDDLSAEALASNSSQGNAAATQLVGALAATLNTQGEESKADGNASGVTDTALVELREGLFAVLASGQVRIAIIAPPAARYGACEEAAYARAIRMRVGRQRAAPLPSRRPRKRRRRRQARSPTRSPSR